MTPKQAGLLSALAQALLATRGEDTISSQAEFMRRKRDEAERRAAFVRQAQLARMSPAAIHGYHMPVPIAVPGVPLGDDEISQAIPLPVDTVPLGFSDGMVRLGSLWAADQLEFEKQAAGAYRTSAQAHPTHPQPAALAHYLGNLPPAPAATTPHPAPAPASAPAAHVADPALTRALGNLPAPAPAGHTAPATLERTLGNLPAPAHPQPAAAPAPAAQPQPAPAPAAQPQPAAAPALPVGAHGSVADQISKGHTPINADGTPMPLDGQLGVPKAAPKSMLGGALALGGAALGGYGLLRGLNSVGNYMSSEGQDGQNYGVGGMEVPAYNNQYGVPVVGRPIF